jgi:hypothetical protein
MKMERPNTINIIHLQDDFKLDGIYFQEEGLYLEEEAPLFADYCDKTKFQINSSLGSHSNLALHYNWNGLAGQFPWSREHNIPFDPTEISVVVAETGSLMKIAGTGRKIVLTHGVPEYDGQDPFYSVICSGDYSSLDVRTLPTRGSFQGLERLFHGGGFESLPRIGPKDGIISPLSDEIIIPSGVKHVF